VPPLRPADREDKNPRPDRPADVFLPALPAAATAATSFVTTANIAGNTEAMEGSKRFAGEGMHADSLRRPVDRLPHYGLRSPAAYSQKVEEETMRDNKKGDEVRPKVQWTAEDRARHRAIRDMFRNWHPSPEELIASGEAANFDLHGEYRELRPFVEEIKRAREAAGLTLAEVSRRCGIDQPALSRLENGQN
jgi:hypothetical protein